MHDSGCVICGGELEYSKSVRMKKCAICGKKVMTNVMCKNGHFVCDECHSGDGAERAGLLLASEEKDPLLLFRKVVALPSVHLHGPEHHSIVAEVMLTALRNCGGDVELAAALREAMRRGAQVPGGTCGYWGVCGAAAGAGIYASIISGASPLNGEAWHVPMLLTERIIHRLAEIGGPRCCKRTCSVAIECSAAFTEEQLGIKMPCERRPCGFFNRNRECIHEKCPYYPENMHKE